MTQVAGGRIPAHNLEAEESLLGAMLLSVNAIVEAIEVVRAEDFYKPAHGHVFDAVGRLYGANDACDAVTVSEELRRLGLLDSIGGPEALVMFQSRCPAISNAAHYARIVHSHALLRRLGAVAGDIGDLSYSMPTDVAETLDQAERMVFDLANTGRRRRAVQMEDALGGWLDLLEARLGRGELSGIATGWRDLDDKLHGLRGGQVIIVAGRPSMGKSQMAVALASAAGSADHPVLFVSLEMSESELLDRFVAAAATVPLDDIRKATISTNDWPRINNAIGRVAAMPIVIADDPSATLLTIRGEARRMASRHGRLGLVVIDYLQLMEGTKAGGYDNREREVAEISRGLKKMAKELDVPVVALSQLNRELEKRANKRPTLSDLRESGAIEQDSDVVLAVYRDEVYNQKTDDHGVAEVLILKQRNGPIGTVRLAYEARYGQFRNMTSEEQI